MKSKDKISRYMLISAMVIFGTIGILRKYIPYASSLIALVRGVIGTVFLGAVILLRGQGMDRKAVRSNFWLLLLSGVAIGFNWILLFEAYCYTSVAAATLCYYLAPTLVILASPLLFREKLTVKNLLCAGASLLGMILVSGILDADFRGLEELKGILLALGAAALYACVILMNKGMKPIPAFDKTVFQLGSASLALLPYVLLTENLSAIPIAPLPVILLLVAGVVHTGVAYALYFGSMGNLPSQTIAMLSYIDPILAVVLSALLLGEPMTLGAGIGAVLILGSAIINER